MRSLLLTIGFPPEKGGVQDYLYNIVKHLKSQTIVLAPNHVKSTTFDKTQQFKIYRSEIFSAGKPKRIRMFIDAFKIIKNEKLDIVQCGQTLPVGLIALLLKVVTKTPYVVYTHGLDVIKPQSNFLRKAVLLQVLNFAAKIFVNSEFTKNEVVKLNIPEEKIVKLTPGIDFKDFLFHFDREKFKQRNNLVGFKIVISIGRLVERKGFDYTIKALPSLLKKFPNTIYLIIGEGPYKAILQRLVREEDVGDNVRFLGALNRKEMIKYLFVCDVLVMPSRVIADQGEVEGFGIVFLEANACGKPVIGSYSGGIKDAVVDGKTGLLVKDPTSVKEVSDKISLLLSNPALAEKLGKFGRERVRKQFDWERLANTIGKELHSLQR